MPENSEEFYGIQEIDADQRQKKRTLKRLLDELQDKANHHLVLQVEMGDVRSYLTSVTLSWVAESVGFASDLPVFKRDEQESDRGHRSRIDLENRQQRVPNWTRQRDMAAYLASRRHHKFPALLLVGYQNWVYDERNEMWGENGRAMSDSLNLRPLDTTGMCFELSDLNTKYYALDGQHRLMAIRGLRDLIKDGRLPARDRQGKVRSTGGLSRDDIIRRTGENMLEAHVRLQFLMDERIGVEIVPAIRRDESEEEGRRRLRQMFVDVNEHAKPLSQGELTQLDESDGYRVVARKLVADHPLLRIHVSEDGEVPDQHRVELVKTQLSEGAECYTTLKILAETVQAYLTENGNLSEYNEYVSWNNLISKKVTIRPDEAYLDAATKDMTEYFNLLATLPSHGAFISGKPAKEIRRSERGDDNILFRPLAQVALATAIGKLATHGVSPEDAIKTLAEQELEGQLKLTNRTTPWFGVLCDPNGKMRRHQKNRDLCCRLLVFLLGSGIEDEVELERLREDFAEQRLIDPEKGRAVDVDGEIVDVKDVQLPGHWR